MLGLFLRDSYSNNRLENGESVNPMSQDFICLGILHGVLVNWPSHTATKHATDVRSLDLAIPLEFLVSLATEAAEMRY